jgi:amino acid transporter
MDNKRNKIISSFGIAAVVAIAFIVFATIFGELYGPFKDWLKETFNHHWIGKGVIAIVIFYLLGFLGICKMSNSEKAMTRMLNIVFWIALLGALSITGFYLYEYLIHV